MVDKRWMDDGWKLKMVDVRGSWMNRQIKDQMMDCWIGRMDRRWMDQRWMGR